MVHGFSELLNKSYLFEYMAAITGSVSVLSSGINLGWTSPYLPKILNGTYADISMTSDEGSWCAVMPLVGAIPGALLITLIVDKVGRKNSILLMAPIVCAAFIVLAFAKSAFLISAVRFIIGSAEGGLYTALPIYLGEISSPKIRGILTASMGLFVILGTLLINVLGFYYSIFFSSLICALIPTVHFVTFIWMPESPYYLIKQGNISAAEHSLKILRRTSTVEEELELLKNAVFRQELHKKSKFTALFTVKSNRRAFMIYFILNFTRKFSGKNPLLFYTTTVFELAEGSLSANVSVVIFICIELLAAVVALSLIDKAGRRPLIITSTSVCAMALSCAGIYFLVKELNSAYISWLGWLPLTSLTFYNIFYTIGLELMYTTYLGELFPTNIKAVALGLADIISVINGTIASKIFQILVDNLGMYYPFFTFSACCLIGLVLVIMYVPETKNKSLEEIQLYLIKKTSSPNKTTEELS